MIGFWGQIGKSQIGFKWLAMNSMDGEFILFEWLQAINGAVPTNTWIVGTVHMSSPQSRNGGPFYWMNSLMEEEMRRTEILVISMKIFEEWFGFKMFWFNLGLCNSVRDKN